MPDDQISIFSGNLPGEQLIKSVFNGVTGVEVVKWAMVAGLFMYSLFALVIIKQVGIMTETLEEDANGVIKIFAWAHFLTTIFLIVTAVLL